MTISNEMISAENVLGLLLTDPNPCQPQPCDHGYCLVEAKDMSTMVDILYQCECDQGYEGDDCSVGEKYIPSNMMTFKFALQVE